MYRWIKIPHDLKVRESHSSQNLIMEMRRDSRYIHLGQERKHLLFPLKFQPPLLIYPLLSVNEGLDEYGRVVGDSIWKMYNDCYINCLLVCIDALTIPICEHIAPFENDDNNN